jgi:hypothetical protein
MGLFSSFFNKAGAWHIKQLVKDSCDHVIKATMAAHEQKNNPFLVDYALDLLIEHGSYSLMKEEKYICLKEKLKDFMTFYVVRNIGRDIDFLSGEDQIMLKEIEKYWTVFIKSKDGTEQLVNTEKQNKGC